VNVTHRITVSVIALAGAVGCSFGSDAPTGSRPGMPSLGSIGGAPAATGSGGTPGFDAGASQCSWADPEHPACAGALYHGQALPLDVYVMFDESGSMATMDDGVTMRIDAVRNAVGQFLSDPDSAGVSVGIGYFGTQPLSCACTSCNPNDYAKPAVPLGILPAAAPALVASLSKQAPTGETPTGAALRGACSYATTAKQARPDHAVVILLVTDGIPQAPLTSQAGGCNPTLADANAAAASCFGAATPIRTYVLGVGPSLANLNQIAAAGGTGHAYLVESAGSAGVLAALGAIRQDAMIPCSLGIPTTSTGGGVDLATVNVVYADANCGLTTFVNVGKASSCDPQRGGWYYDDPSRPTSIQLCGASCGAVGAPGGELRVSVGCSTIVVGAITH
jgi:hypothetical protein